MASHKQAAKRARRSEQRKIRNVGIKTRVKRAVRAFREATDKETAAKAFRHAAQELRSAASKGVMHARTASRRVSRLSRAFNKM